MGNIEEDIKILENYLKDSSYKEKENNFFKGSGWEVVDLEIPQAMANVLTEFKKDKKRIQELEEALLKVKDKNTTLFITCRNSIPKQKVKDKIERHEFAKKYFEKEYDNKHYEDDGIRARDFYGIVTQDRIIQVLEELLEDK